MSSSGAAVSKTDILGGTTKFARWCLDRNCVFSNGSIRPNAKLKSLVTFHGDGTMSANDEAVFQSIQIHPSLRRKRSKDWYSPPESALGADEASAHIRLYATRVDYRSQRKLGRRADYPRNLSPTPFRGSVHGEFRLRAIFGRRDDLRFSDQFGKSNSPGIPLSRILGFTPV
jgi:hypothetical protein